MDINVFPWTFVAVLAACCMDPLSAQQPMMKCYQCNVFSKGKQQFCELDWDQLIVPDCLACLKTFTFTSIHDRWSNPDSLVHRFRVSTSYLSRYCLTELDSDLIKEEGCYKVQGPNGFTEQCFCHSELCNTSTRATLSVIAALSVCVGVLWTALGL